MSMLPTVLETGAAPAATPEIKTVQDVLRHAARYIEEHGWGQGQLVTPEGAVCAVGAVFSVTGSGRLRRDALVNLSGQLAYPADSPRRHVEMWNDDLDRTEGEVTAALRWTAGAMDIE